MLRLIPFLILAFSGCTTKSPKHKITVNEGLEKPDIMAIDSLFSDTSIIDGFLVTDDSTSLWYSNSGTRLNYCECLLERDSLRVIVGVNAIFDGVFSEFRIKDGYFNSSTSISSCLEGQYKPSISSELSLNSYEYIVGDTVIGEFKNSGFVSEIDLTKRMKLEGKFQCIIRNPN